MIFSFDFSFQMQFHQNQCVSANVSPLVKWHLLTEKCFVGNFPTGSCRERATAAAGREERGVSPAPGLELSRRSQAAGRTFQSEPSRLERGRQETRPGLCPRPCPAAHAPPSEGSQSRAELSPCLSTALDRAPGTARTAISSPLAAVPASDVTKGEMSLIPIR